MLPRSPFVSGKLSGAPFNHYAKILMLVRDIPPAIRDFKIFAHGRSLDLNRFGFITLWRATFSTSFVSCTANETSGGSFKMNEWSLTNLLAKTGGIQRSLDVSPQNGLADSPIPPPGVRNRQLVIGRNALSWCKTPCFGAFVQLLCSRD